MPYKYSETKKVREREYYKRNKTKWKNPDGSWKRPSDYGTKEFWAKKRAWYHKNKAAVKAARKKERIAKRVIGTCPTCMTEAQQLYKDHCHTTSYVRGYICPGCNLALGHAKNNPEVLRRLAKWLEEKRPMELPVTVK